jgi:TrwC relaxase
MHGCPQRGGGGQAKVALPVKALKAGQEAYWLDQIARNREEYFSGRGESPGRFVGSVAHASGLDGIASPEQVRAMFQGLDPATGEQRCAPLWRADPRSKLPPGRCWRRSRLGPPTEGSRSWRRWPGPRR